MRSALPVRLAALAAASALLATACSNGDAVEESPSPSLAITTTTEPAAPGAVVIEVADGVVVGGEQRQRVALGETITLAVTSDVADEIHVHGYDVLAEVAAGSTATVTVEATIPGVFEVELENAGIVLAELEVR